MTTTHDESAARLTGGAIPGVRARSRARFVRGARTRATYSVLLGVLAAGCSSEPDRIDFMAPTDAGAEEEVGGVQVRVVELTATAGDLVRMHPLLLHSRPTNAGRAPRFLLMEDLTAPAAARSILEAFRHRRATR